MCARFGFNLLACAVVLLLVWLSAIAQTPPPRAVDLATVATDGGVFQRVYGSVGIGFLGVPVAGGVDCDGDRLPDVAMASILASPLQRRGAGEVYLEWP